MMKIRLLTFTAITTMLFFASTHQADGRTVSTCNTQTLEIEVSCNGLDTSNDMDDNPFIYINLEASCDLDLDLPGLPSMFDGLLGGDFDVNLCSAFQSVTDELVDSINDELDDAMNRAMDDVASQQDRAFADELEQMALDALNNPGGGSGGSGGSGGGRTGGGGTDRYNEYGQDRQLRGSSGCSLRNWDRRLCGCPADRIGADGLCR